MRRTDPNVVPLPSSADSLPPKVFEIESQGQHTESDYRSSLLTAEPAIQARPFLNRRAGNDKNQCK